MNGNYQKKTKRINRVPWKEIPSISRAKMQYSNVEYFLFQVQNPRDLATVNLWLFILVDIWRHDFLLATLFARVHCSDHRIICMANDVRCQIQWLLKESGLTWPAPLESYVTIRKLSLSNWNAFFTFLKISRACQCHHFKPTNLHEGANYTIYLVFSRR